MSYLRDIAAEILVSLDWYQPVENREMVQSLALAEEVGEFIGAYRRWSGNARRSGTYDKMAEELADVVISSYVMARVLGMDLDEEIESKIKVVFARPWKDDTSDG